MSTLGLNPFRRLRQLADVNQTEMARRAEVTRQTIATLELGMYDIVPTKANHALANSCRLAGVDARHVLGTEYGAVGLDAAMDRWKTQKRTDTDLSEWPVMSLSQIIRKFESPRQFCDKLCIPTYALHNALYRNEAMHPVIPLALREAGYPHVESL